MGHWDAKPEIEGRGIDSFNPESAATVRHRCQIMTE
jgi:hypothetical protein